MRVINLSVDGIFQAAQRGLYDWLQEQDADIICLQDIRAQEYELDDTQFHPEGYCAYFFDSGIPQSNGVVIYTREQPKALIFGLGFSSGTDMEGRYLQVDFERISIGSLLAPSAADDPASQEAKITFFDDFQAHLNKISHKRREFIFCGNWQMAHTQKDVTDPQTTAPGFLPYERQCLDQIFNQIGYADTFRQDNTDADEYSWWPSGKIGEGLGLRTDFQVSSNSLRSYVEYATIYKSKQFSSHLPVIVDYDLELL